MTTVFHVVGERGSGKSMVIVALAAYFKARGYTCAGVDPAPACSSLAEAMAESPNADVVFLEHRDDQFAAAPGDQLIRLSQVPVIGQDAHA